jgi:hypothetical protein
MDAESVEKKFFALLRKSSTGKVSTQELINYMQKVEEFCEEEGMELSEFLEEVFPDVICEEVHEIINDSDWRSDEVGKNCVVDPEILRQLYPILTKIDENTELVFATNPHTPPEILEELSESTYDWEEDGTASALARNTDKEALLRKLAANPDPSVRFSVAENPKTPQDVLQLLASDEHFSEHMLYMAFDGGMSPSATDPAEEMIKCSIKFAVLHNPNSQLALITQIAGNESNFDVEGNSDFFGSQGAGINSAIKREAEKVLQSRS